jgi:multidrug efflux pump subunit AcrA (membrane-fusion protein)
MRKVLIIIIIVVVLAIAIAVRIGTSNRTEETEEVNIVPVEVMSVVNRNVRSSCELIGTIKAAKTAQVFPETMGRITRIFVKEGTYVNKNSNLMALRNETIGFEYEEGVGSMVSPQAPVALVVEYSRVEVAFDMSENAIGCVDKSSKVRVAIDALPDVPFTGTVSEVSPVIDPATRSVRAKATIENTKKILKPGMTARVILTLGARDDVLAVPRDALLDGYLFVVIDSTAERRDVEVGLVGDEYVEILSGLAEDELVVVVGQQRLAGGEKVNPIPGSE